MTGARWLSVVGLSIVLAVILTFPTPPAPLGAVSPAEEADAVAVAERLTAELLGQVAAGAETSAGARSLLDIAGERQAAMRILQTTEPAEFLRLALSSEAHQSLPPEVQGMTEKYVSKTGDLQVTFQGEVAIYTLDDGAVTYELQFVLLPDVPEGGSVVEVNGILLDDMITLYAPVPNAGFHVLVQPPGGPSIGEQRNLVVL